MSTTTQTNELTDAATGQENSTSKRWLNGVDRFLLAVDRTIRGLSGPGFETQTFIWLNSPVDTTRLFANLVRLVQRHPVLVSRLVERDGPYWQLRPGATPALREAHLATVSRQAVLNQAAKLLAGATDPADVDPVRFHLFHRPDGRDVLVVQYNHALIDHSDAILLLQQLDDTTTSNVWKSRPHPPWRDATRDYLRRFSRTRRHAAASSAMKWRSSLRGGAVHLGQLCADGSSHSFRLKTRRLDRAATAAIQAHIVGICGVPSLSMGALACAFRAIGGLAASGSGDYLNAGIGVDLGLNRGGLPALQNLASLVPLQISRGKLGERDALICMLTQQLRDELTHDIDLGVLEVVTAYGRQQHRVRWSIELLLRYCLSLWYGSFGAIRGLGPQFCGAEVEEVFSARPAWSPIGLTLLVNQFAGRLHLQATHIPECVSDATANRFLDAIVADLSLA